MAASEKYWRPDLFKKKLKKKVELIKNHNQDRNEGKFNSKTNKKVLKTGYES